MSQPTCTHPFHDDPPQGDHYDVGGLIGYRCPACGFETVRAFPATPQQKTCAGCAAEFTGAAEIGDERCDGCFETELTRYLADLKEGQ